MRCLACGAEMEVVGVAGGDPEGEPILVSGFERRTHKCLSCGATEQRLVFSREDSGAANSLSPEASSEPTDSTKQEDAARLAEQFHEPIDSDRQEAAPRPPEPFSVAPADTVEHNEAAPPPQSTSTSADGREHDEAPNTWARSLERIQQRITVLAEESARERAAKASRRAPKKKIAIGPEEAGRFEADRLTEIGAVRTPPQPELSPTSAVAMPLDELKKIEAKKKEPKEIAWPGDILSVPVPPPAPRPSPSPEPSAGQPDALAQTPPSDLTPTMPAPAQTPDEHPEQAAVLPQILQDSTVPSVPSEVQGQEKEIQEEELQERELQEKSVQDRDEPQAPRTSWTRAMAALLPTRVFTAVKKAIRPTNTDAPKE